MSGSPNGVAAGYFLAQHKRQLGGNKYIPRIKAFCNDGDFTTTQLLFYVEDAPPPPPPPESSRNTQAEETGLLAEIKRSSVDGKNIVRSHVFRAKL